LGQGLQDKKLLWRANLYIKEDAHDWNDDNPWVGTAADPNGWNRKWTDNTIKDNITSLDVGDGKQVIQVPEFTPIVRVSAARAANKLSGTVEYSYSVSGNY
jgi:hypothetical protein